MRIWRPTKFHAVLVVSIVFAFAGCGYEPLEKPEEPDYDPACKASFLPSLYQDVFWFVHITDIEQTRASGSELFSYSIIERSSYHGFRDQLRYICGTVSPAFVVATGDLVYGGLLNQEPAQWEDYRHAVRAACYDSGNYHDMPGNHDVYYSDDFTHYLQYSISGETRHDWVFENGGGRYAFAAFNTARPGYGGGFFSAEEQAWLEKTLTRHKDADYRIVFAHHNALPEMTDLYEPGGVLQAGDVQAFFGGHTHTNDESNAGGILSIRTAAIYKSDGDDRTDGVFRIVSIDDGALASAPKWIFNHGPQVLITYPQDKDYATSANPFGHVVSGLTPVRALAFSGDEVDLAVHVDDGPAVLMEKVNEKVHQAWIDFSDFETGEHEVEVFVPETADSFNPRDTVTVLKK